MLQVVVFKPLHLLAICTGLSLMSIIDGKSAVYRSEAETLYLERQAVLAWPA